MSGFYDEIVAGNGVYKYFGAGEWKESSSGKTVGVLNPTTNKNDYKVQGKCAACTCMIFYGDLTACMPYGSLHPGRGERRL